MTTDSNASPNESASVASSSAAAAANAAAAGGAADVASSSNQNFDRAKLLALLGLPDTATDAEIEGMVTDLMAKAGQAAEATTQMGSLQQNLQAIQTERDTLRTQYDDLYKKQEELDKKQRAAEADAALEPVRAKLTPEKFTQLRELYLTNPDAAKFSLELIEVTNAPAEAGKGTPPDPVHDPNNPGTADTAEQKVAKQNALIKSIQGEGKFTSYTDAREEARRRQPELFQ